MRILGLDPGSLHTGYGVIQRSGRRFRALAVGRISSPRSRELAERLAHLRTEVEELLGRWQPDLVVLESLFGGANPRSLIVLAQARGVLLAAVAASGYPLREFSPAEVKGALTGNGRASKQQVAKMVRLLVELGSEPLAADASDALAVAICCAQRFAMDAARGLQPPLKRIVNT